MDFMTNSEREVARTHNSTFAIGGVSCSADSLVVAKSFVLRIKFSGKNPAHRKSANRYESFSMSRCNSASSTSMLLIFNFRFV
jgi:hypothetical protein